MRVRGICNLPLVALACGTDCFAAVGFEVLPGRHTFATAHSSERFILSASIYAWIVRLLERFFFREQVRSRYPYALLKHKPPHAFEV